MICTKCGQPVAEGVPFCKYCGAPAQQASSPGSPQAPSPPTQAPSPSSPALAGGYGMGWQPPQPPPRPGKNRTGLIIGLVAAGVILVAALAVGLYFGLRGDDSDDTATGNTTLTSSSHGSVTTEVSTDATVAQQEGEILLEAAAKAGPEPFTGETFVPAGPPPSLNLPTTTLAPPTTLPSGAPTTLAVATTMAPEVVQLTPVSGDTPALYGGSKDKALADKEGQLAFFEKNPDKAAAFCAALNSDPTFKWSGGDQIQPSQLRDYFAELTPMMLTRDTRVTNNGYRNGKPTPRQSVLQKGQMVLVDQYGVPRVRCECGNPLAPPKAVKKAPKYTGPKWPDFDPATIIVVQPTTVIINIFVVVDINTGDTFDRPAGTTGDQDTSTDDGGDVPPATDQTAGTEPQELFNNGNIGGVSPGATAPTFVLKVATKITVLQTYHYIGGGLPGAGTIGLQGADGTMYGPFQATGSDGQGGVANAYWTVNPDDLVLPAGSYTILDSDPGTWSQNGESGGVGMSSVWGIPLE